MLLQLNGMVVLKKEKTLLLQGNSLTQKDLEQRHLIWLLTQKEYLLLLQDYFLMPRELKQQLLIRVPILRDIEQQLLVRAPMQKEMVRQPPD